MPPIYLDYNASTPIDPALAAAQAANARTSPVLIGSASELEEAFSIMSKDGAQAVIAQGFFGPCAKQIVGIANRHRMGYMSTDRSAD